ncbi:MAG: CPBP family intramembrane metalloprotease [Chloroflexi bacterium]|nr:CPBP family intramembrane metalloprotease [Chloroflexota bacterium]
MNQSPHHNKPHSAPPPAAPQPASWSANDAWLGLGLLIIVIAVYLVVVAQLGDSRAIYIFVITTFEMLLLIPIAMIFLLRRISWKDLGLRGFDRNNLSLGCGLLVFVYIFMVINKLIMRALGIISQAESLSELIDEIDSPLLFVFVTAIIAPFTEELFFRGFLFKGLREKYGWIHALMFSSIIFALFHGQIATLIPTFLLGALFAYLYQRTESVYPGMILHFIINAMGAFALLFANQAGML